MAGALRRCVRAAVECRESLVRPTRGEGDPLFTLALARGIVSLLILFDVYRLLGRTVERSRRVAFEPVLATLEAAVHTGPGQPTPRDPMDVGPVTLTLRR